MAATALAIVTRSTWMRAVGRSLVCDTRPAGGDAILIDNVDYNYLVFERAGELQRAYPGLRIFVPALASRDPERVNRVSGLIVDAMARVAEVNDPVVVPVVETEPISLNVAYGMAAAMASEGVRSVVIVSPAFRSRRTELIYKRVLEPIDIKVGCVPVYSGRTPDTWTRSWHGIQEVLEQSIKLQYYKWKVLPQQLARRSQLGWRHSGE